MKWCEHVKEFNEESLKNSKMLGSFRMVDEKVCMKSECMDQEELERIKHRANIIAKALKDCLF